tara:strand:- start:637 stop:1413 length:777 start_codon:yes stop_codon:yes gene_type:complete
MSQCLKDSPYADPEIMISEQDGVRSLHLGGSMVQSAMKISVPNDLELSYTQCMMGFLLFHACPTHILMIGLGGGSLAKFVHHRMPKSQITAVELNPQVVSVAVNHFALPAEDARFEVIIAEGGEYIARHSLSTDILMIDGFDDGCQVPSLCSQDFYNQARRVLNKNGILVVNFLSRDKNVSNYLRCIENSFNGHVVKMLSDVDGNLIVFAMENSPGRLAWKTLKKRAKTLEKEYPLPFSEYVAKLRKYNLCHANYLAL